MEIISLSYKAQTGKDTTADYLVANHGFTKMSLADPLRDAAHLLFGLKYRQMLDPDLKDKILPEWKMSPRDILKKLGTECIRNNFGQDFWPSSLLKKARAANVKRLVIPDARFLSEINIFKTAGGKVGLVNRNNTGIITTGHPSEIELDSYNQWDFVLDNNSSFEFLYQEIEEKIINGKK